MIAALSPLPKKVVAGRGAWRLPNPVRVSQIGLAGNFSGTDTLCDFFRQRGSAIRFVGPGTAADVIVSVNASLAPPQPEGYALDIRAKQIVIAAHDKAGCRHAVRTLSQIAPNNAIVFPAVRIQDWPDFAIRGAHLTLFRYEKQRPSLVFWNALIEKVAAPAKLNTLIVQVDWNLRYRSHPEMGQLTGFTHDELSQLCETGRRQGIAVIPHLQCLSHQYFLVGHGHPEWLLSSESETYRPETLNLRPLLGDLMRELFAVFGETPQDSWLRRRYGKRPPLHVGFDEVDSAISPAQFFPHLQNLAADARKIGFPAVAIWPDMLARYDPEGGGRNLLEKLPFGTILCPWDYRDQDDFALLDPFAKTSFPVWATGSAKYERDNVAKLSRAAYRRKCEGLIGSTWNSWNSTLLPGIAKPLSSLLLAGEFGWNTTPRSLSFDPIARLKTLLQNLSPVAR